MRTMLKTVAIWSSVAALVTLGVGATLAGQQDQPAAPARGRGAPPPPPPPQAGHPTGKLVIWGDLASYDQPATSPTDSKVSRYARIPAVVGSASPIARTSASVYST